MQFKAFSHFYRQGYAQNVRPPALERLSWKCQSLWTEPFRRTRFCRLVTFSWLLYFVYCVLHADLLLQTLLVLKVWALPWTAGALEHLCYLPLCFLVDTVKHKPNSCFCFHKRSWPTSWVSCCLCQRSGSGLIFERCQAVLAGRLAPYSIWCQWGSQLVPRPCYSKSTLPAYSATVALN